MFFRQKKSGKRVYLQIISTRRIGPALVFARLWEELQIPQVIRRLLAGRRFTLPQDQQEGATPF